VSNNQFLESVDNLRRVVRQATGRDLNAERALQSTVCLRQGRLFFEAAQQAGAEIRPLLLFYGAVAFAKATIVARTHTKLESLPRAHGLRDISAPNATLSALRGKVQGDGVFQRLADMAREVERISTLRGTHTEWFDSPSCRATDIESLEFTLKDVLARVGSLSTLYRETFEGEPLALACSIIHKQGDIYELQVNIPAKGRSGAEDVLSVIADLKEKFPFIKRLNLKNAMFVYGDIRIELDNVSPGGAFPTTASELSPDLSGTALYFPRKESPATIRLGEILPCGQGGIEGHFPTFSSAFREEAYLSEVVLHYMGLFLLGSLVRYRPEIWIHSLYGHHNSERPRDDSARALVERFLDLVSIQVPAWCGAAIRAPLAQSRSP
jgi:hypothetical protein